MIRVLLVVAIVTLAGCGGMGASDSQPTPEVVERTVIQTKTVEVPVNRTVVRERVVNRTVTRTVIRTRTVTIRVTPGPTPTPSPSPTPTPEPDWSQYIDWRESDQQELSSPNTTKITFRLALTDESKGPLNTDITITLYPAEEPRATYTFRDETVEHDEFSKTITVEYQWRRGENLDTIDEYDVEFSNTEPAE